MGEFMFAAGTGDFLLAAAPFGAQEQLAVGALEITVFLTVLCAVDKLAVFGLPVGGKLDILPVLLPAFLVVFGEHPEEGPDIQGKADEGQQADAGEAAQDGADQAGDEGEHAQVVGTVATLHETGEGFTNTLEKSHGVIIPFMQ